MSNTLSVRLDRGERRKITLTLNGRERSGYCESRDLLSDFVRHELGATLARCGYLRCDRYRQDQPFVDGVRGIQRRLDLQHDPNDVVEQPYDSAPGRRRQHHNRRSE